MSHISLSKITRIHSSCNKYNNFKNLSVKQNQCKSKLVENKVITIGKKVLLLASVLIFSPILALIKIDYDLEEISNRGS